MSNEKQLKILMIGAHLDDNEWWGAGTALHYLDRGHRVRFLSVCNGCGGHHELSPEAIAKRRYGEAQAVARLVGLEYDVWDIPDCELVADLDTRKRMVRYIREFDPDIIFTHRLNDYHADHRATALLVQDASYLLIVPNFCADTEAMRKMPVIVYFEDLFRNPPFKPGIAINIDSVIDRKYAMFHCHKSQLYEWLPYTYGILDQVPAGDEERLEWYRSPRVPRSAPLPLEKLLEKAGDDYNEHTAAVPAAKHRDLLVKRYGEAGKTVLFAETFEVSEYGTQLNEETEKILFPF